ncbi:MAG TPA: DUF4350 domain-containing protein [Planctomycetaceae bacterium]|nr:DUF4350 domain-containing protein [Planctomycetaceae bacterium]
MTERWRPGVWWIWPALAATVLALHVAFPDAGTGVLHDTYSPTAEGQKAFYRLVSEYAEWTDRNNQPLARAISAGAIEPTLCILGPERWPTAAEWDAILDWVERGGQFVFACSGTSEEAIPRLDIRYMPRESSGPPDDSLPPETDLVATNTIAWWTDGRLIAPTHRVLVEYDGTTQAVAGELGLGRYVISASALVFSNQLLTYGDNPVFAYRLLEEAGDVGGVTFDESLNTTGTPKAVGLLFDRELRPLTLQLLLILIGYAWWNGRRFGPLIRQSVTARHNIVDHTDAVGSAYWRARDGGASVRAVLTLLRSELRESAHLSTASARLTLAAERLGRPVASLQADLQSAHRFAEADRLDRRIAAGIIRKLSVIRQALQRPPR